MQPIRKAAVLGSGVMGSGIAAHLANAGIEVQLLDMLPRDLSDSDKNKTSARNKVAAGAVAALLKQKPAPLFHASIAKNIKVGNFEDDLSKLGDVDLVIEAIIERLDIKQSMFEKLEKVLNPNALVASNTSGLRIKDMMTGRSDSFKKRFFVMHFFNPVRYMKLLELVKGEDTAPEVMEHIATFGREVLGKGIVFGKDTPNFVGNRIGIHAIMSVIQLMEKEGLSFEDVDSITGVPMGHPKSATFRTADIVGIDTFAHVADNCFNALTSDEDRTVFEVPAYIRKMVEQKILGDKTKGGFYKKGKTGEIETLDHNVFAYRPKATDETITKACKALSKIEDPKVRIAKLVATEGKTGEFAWKVIARSLAYSARRVGEISDDIIAIDQAMKWGFNWELGPFEIWDAIGFEAVCARIEKEGIKLPDSIAKMKQSGATLFYKDGQAYDLLAGKYTALKTDKRHQTVKSMRKSETPVLKNGGAEAYDWGDGVLGLMFKTKANSIDADVIQMMWDATERAEKDFRAMVIANEGEHFCVGANLFAVMLAAGQKQWDPIRDMIQKFQGANQRMKYARVPVVAAPFGMALGGGLEVCLGATAVQAAAETYSGLVEVGVGLIPGGAGNLNLLWRTLETIPDGMTVDTYAAVTNVFKSVALAKVATSATEAQRFGYFRNTDGISFDRDRQLYEAKARAIGLAEAGHHPPAQRAYVLPGESGIATLSMMVDTLVASGHATEHDALIARKLANVLCGGVSGSSKEVTEQEMLDLECEAFLSLCGEQKSQERMGYMLQNNKPLRN